MIKRLIFDVDGTLITGVNFTGSMERTLKKIGLYSENNVQLFSEGIKTYEQEHDNYNIEDYRRHIEKAINKPLPNDFVYTFFEELKMCIPPINQSLIDTIHSLSEEYELVLLTNYFAQSQLNRLNNMHIGKYFKESYGEHHIKPNRIAYLEACGDKKPSECIMIGDDIYLDVMRAKQEGLNTIFVNNKGIEVNPNIGIVVTSVQDISKKLIMNLEEEQDLDR